MLVYMLLNSATCRIKTNEQKCRIVNLKGFMKMPETASAIKHVYYIDKGVQPFFPTLQIVVFL